MSQCKCAACYGAAEFMMDLTGKDYGLPRAPGHRPQRLRVIPAAVRVVSDCDGTLTCECARCERDRRERVAAASRTIRQPWEVRPLRRAA